MTLHKLKPEVVLLQETKLTPQDTLRIRGYHVLRKERSRGRRLDAISGGGVATLIREGTSFTPMDKKCTAPNDDTSDALLVELTEPYHLQILNMYVPPIRAGSSTDTRTQNFSPDHWPYNTNLLICADVNGHSAAWDPLMEEDGIGEQVTDWMTQQGFVQPIPESRPGKAPPLPTPYLRRISLSTTPP